MKLRLSQLDAIERLCGWRLPALCALPVIVCACVAVSGLGLKGSIAWFCFAVPFYGVFWLALSLPKARAALSTIRLCDWAVALVIVALVSLVIAGVLSQERYIFYWDQGSYWYRTQNAIDALSSHPKQALIDAYTSINMKTYNDIAPMLMAAPLWIAGKSYPAFSALVTICFDFPAMVCAAVIVRVTCSISSARRSAPLWLCCVLFFVYSSLMLPQIRGYNDAAASLMAFIAFTAVACCDQERFDAKAAIVLGLSLLGAVLTRRYFANWAAGFTVGLIVFLIVKARGADGDRIQAFKAMLFTFMCAGAIAAVLAISLFSPLFLKALTEDYAFAYQAYDAGTGFLGKAVSLLRWTGLIVGVVCVASLALIVGRKETRSFGLLLVIAGGVGCVLFWRIQDMGYHHYLIVAPEIYLTILLGCGVIWAGRLVNARLGKAIASSVLCVWCAVSVAYYVGMVTYAPELGFVLGNGHHVVRVRDDFEELQKLAGSFEDDDTIWVAASSGVMNNNLLENCFKELAPRQAQVVASNIDERDGFRTSFFKANKVVVCSPAQIHKSADHQHVVVDMVPLLLDENGFVGKHYRLVETYTLDKNVTAYVYERVDSYSADDVRAVEAVFDACHADLPELFHDRFEGFIRQEHLG